MTEGLGGDLFAERPSPVLVIPFPFLPPSLSDVIGSSRFQIQKMRGNTHFHAKCSLRAVQYAPITLPVRLRYVLFTPTMGCDCDNFCTKWVTDELRRCSVIANDSMKWVKGVTHDYGGHGCPGRMILEITYA